MREKIFSAVTFLLLLLLLQTETKSFAADGVIVKVSKAVYGDIHVKHEYTGFIQAVQSVQIKPEVSAKINKVHFKEGSYVKAGQTLFTLESSQFNATVALRKAELQNAEANLERARKYLQRLKAADKRSVPASDMDTADANVKQGQANVAQAKASLQIAQIDAGRTRITAPISGIIGRAEFTKGNYVGPSSTLATIVQSDPIRAAIDIPDSDYLEIKNNDYKAEIQGYNLSGEHEFDDNYIASSTGTIKTWWLFDNPDNNLISGAGVHVLLSPKIPEKGVLIPQAAKISANNANYVYVIKNNKAHYTKITVKADTDDGMSAVTGINTGDLVVVEGIQKLFDNAPVQIQE
ncbi:MAG: efflux RND transporter periplasmic adaptor subunit [Synergistaceae bacterium]|nr:efflux RND transporter periplasmic adaptor subunit [Synergistaceae bacterium]